MKEKILFNLLTMALLLFIVAGGWSPLKAEQFAITGTWSGEIFIQGIALQLIFNVDYDSKGFYQGTMDVPAQGAQGIPLSQIIVNNGAVTLDVAMVAGSFSGKFNKDGDIDGSWSQSGLKLPLLLKKGIKPSQFQVNRPQEPKPPFPYLEEEVLYKNKVAGINLAGTLTMPKGKGPFPVVILISGSGPQDRNEELFEHKPFWVLADYLTRLGIAVLRVDDRGVGGSSGNFSLATTLDFAEDVQAGVEYLKQRKEIDKKKIGLIGHSEGGLIAPLVAAKDPTISFIVLMAGPGLPGLEISILQTQLLNRIAGVSEESISQDVELLKQVAGVATSKMDERTIKIKLKEIYDEYLKLLPPEALDGFGDLDEFINLQISSYLSPWYKFFLTHDPAPVLAKVTCPVLAINGDLDLQVPALENLKAIGKALEKGGNKNYSLVELPGLNHLFQTAVTGAPSEYMLIEETMAPLALRTIGEWIISLVNKK